MRLPVVFQVQEGINMGRKTIHSDSNFTLRHCVWKTVAALGCLAGAHTLALADGINDEPWGYDTVAGRCVVCHSLEKGGPFRVAPNLWGIVGAEKARDRSWYAYSPALIEKGGTWTDGELNAFLADPDTFLPGTRKSIKVVNDQEREQIIEFLNQLHD
jgi:cytochrome c2